MAVYKDIKNIYISQTDIDNLGRTENLQNLKLLAFKFAAANELSDYAMVDGYLDAYEDATGVDTGGSTDEILNTTSNYYSGAQDGNYFGDGSLGDVTFGASSITQANDSTAIDTVLSTGSESGGPGSSSYGGSVPNSSACYELTVPNHSGSYDGDMVVANFNTLTINASVTLTTQRPCRGMLIYVKGNCVINGALSMTSRGGSANPTTSGSSSSDAVSGTGIRMPMVTSGGSSTLSAADFNGCGTSAKTAVANQAAISGNGTIFAVSQVGGSAGAGVNHSYVGCGSSVSPGGTEGNTGSAGATGAVTIGTGGGGSGAGSAHYGTPNGNSGPGGAGGAFSGGAGGGGAVGRSTTSTGGTGGSYGGSGGNGDTGASGSSGAGGGAGNTGGTNETSGVTFTNAQNGVGGLIWLIVGGTLTIASGATVEAKGVVGSTNGNGYTAASGGSSGGGACMVLHSGALSNSGSITAAGGVASSGSGSGCHGPNAAYRGGAGGAGGVHTAQVSTASAYNNMTLISNAQTATAAPTEIRLQLFEEMVTANTINTDIKGWVSRDNGTTFTQVTLADEGDWQSGKRVFAGTADVSGQPSGTSIKYKVTTHNQATSRQARIHGACVLWK